MIFWNTLVKLCSAHLETQCCIYPIATYGIYFYLDMAQNTNFKLNVKPDTIVIKQMQSALIGTDALWSEYFCKLSNTANLAKIRIH